MEDEKIVSSLEQEPTDATAVSVENTEEKIEKTDTPPKKKRKSFKEWLISIKPSKRKLIQLYAAVLTNAHLKGFVTGKFFVGNTKGVCAPGLNCYSCPGAVAACPLGSLQAELNAANKSMAFYVVAIIMLYGLILGRTICGWLCPFGLIQELFHKIKTPKLKKNKLTRILSYLKYPILIFFVVVIPIAYGLRNVPLPAFCKYICPAGTLEGAVALLSNQVNESQLANLGPLFTWKFALMVSFIVGSIFIFRFFCRFFCPLGAIYGFFNKFCLLGVKVDKPKCTNCGLCVSKCQMDIKHVGDHECISCGECIDVCPTKAITFKGSKFFLPPDEIDTSGMSEDEAKVAKEENEIKREKTKKRAKVFKIIIASVMAVVMAGALIYYNFIYEGMPTAQLGTDVGDQAPSMSLDAIDEGGYLSPDSQEKDKAQGFVENENGYLSFNPTKTGKLTIINFWGVWCSGCVAELPDFNKIAEDYKGQVVVVAIHTSDAFTAENDAPNYIKDHVVGGEKIYLDSEMIFLVDKESSVPGVDQYYTDLGGLGSYPMTVIIDENGVIVARFDSSVHYDDLKAVIEASNQ